jgi:beta-lactam-binding protein with PASTA domain/serine/threonine protein kinase
VVENETSEQNSGGADRLEGRILADRYRIANVVSSGANTVIVEAIDIEDDRPVTVKIVRPELAETDAFRKAFRRQAEVATALTHPNIATVLGWGDTELEGEPTVFWVVEYLGGGSLRDIFDRGRLLEPSQALVVGLEACRALDAAHQRGIVHSELTPSKMVFGEDGRLRVVDFGMAALLGAEAWSEPATVATHVARYASPEQALGMAIDAKTDVYALSLCLIEATTGKVPFAGDSTVSTLAARVGKLMPVSADLGSLASVLERAGRPEAEDRTTAAEFGQALVQAAETLPRPEPLPLMEASLFAATVRAQADTPGDDEPVLNAATPGEMETSEPDTSESGASESGSTDSDIPLVAGVAAAAVVAESAGADETVDAKSADEAAAAEESASGEPGDVEVVGAEAVEDELADTELGDVEAVEDESVDEEPDEGDGPDEGAADVVPLLLLTDIADPPTGAVQVADNDGADAAAPSSTDQPSPTQEMPAEMAAAAAVATVAPSTDTMVADPTPSGTIYDEENNGKPWGKIVLLVLVGLVCLGALSYAGWLLLRTKSYEVPDVVGVEETVALNEVSGNGWKIETEHERSDAVPEIDHVVRSNPAAGVKLDEGEVFVLYVSDGPKLRTLPELDGLPLDEALGLLTDLRLLAIEAPPEFSETVPAGSVISWQVRSDASLTAGAQVLPETTIVLTVSKGPEPRPAPALFNLTFDEATAATDALQLVLARGDDVFSVDVEVGRVVIQTPAPETPVERGGLVSVQLSKGPDMVPIPDLSGMSYPDAQQALTDAGFVINSLLGTTEGTFVAISVDGEEVQAGDLFIRGTGVDLIFL